MTSTRNPPWQRDELILALDLYCRFPPNSLGPNHPAIVELSEVLNRLPIFEKRPDAERFRNPNGVAMKIGNFKRFDPAFIERGTRGLQRGGAGEQVVWSEFSADRERLRKVADAIRHGLSAPAVQVPPDAVESEEEEFPEGRVLYRLHRARERSRALVQKAKDRAMKHHGRLVCSICAFDFATAYGELGRGYMECHHTVPLSEATTSRPTRLEDVALVCANCHRMLHRRRPWLSVEQLSLLVADKKASGA